MNNSILLLACVLTLILFTAIGLYGGSFERGPSFLNVADLKKEFPLGSDLEALQKKIMAFGYKNVSCSTLPKFKTKQKSVCFLKRYCYPSDGSYTSVIGVAYDDSAKVVLIDGGFSMHFHGRCKVDQF